MPSLYGRLLNVEERDAGPTLDDVRELELEQSRLQQQERELLESAYLRRIDGFESIRDATRRLSEIGSLSGAVLRAPGELGRNMQFDRVLISAVREGWLTPQALWERGDERPNLPEAFALRYPMVEHEMAEGQAPASQIVLDPTSRTPDELAQPFAWTSYGVGTIAVDRQVIGLLHADAGDSQRPLDEIDAELILFSCTRLGEVFEQASLRQTLQRHRAELQSAASWLTSRLHATSSRTPAATASAAQTREQIAPDSLTAREREILALLARGRTNGQIARELLIQEGTVKYHVKNVLRKLGARSRADAVARFARATGATPR